MSSRLSGTELFVPDMLIGQNKTCRGERAAKNDSLEAMRQKVQHGHAVVRRQYLWMDMHLNSKYESIIRVPR